LRYIKVLQDDEILGRRGNMPIMQYHEYAVVSPPRDAEVLATSTAVDENGREVDIVEALRYRDNSISIQGHPEEGTAFHVIYNFLEKVKIAVRDEVTIGA
jgi:GMP synthase-like glutamine amidotransferase